MTKAKKAQLIELLDALTLELTNQAQAAGEVDGDDYFLGRRHAYEHAHSMAWKLYSEVERLL